MKKKQLTNLLAVVCGLLIMAGCNSGNDIDSKPETMPPLVNNEIPANNAMGIRVIAFNIRSGRNADGDINLEAIANLIELTDPDIVALQEVDVNTDRSGRRDMVAILAGLTGYKASFGPAMNYDNGHYGNALLTKSPLSETATIELAEGGEPRSAAKGTIASKDNIKIDLYSAHFDAWKKLARVDSSYQLNRLATDSGRLAILAGDLNAEVNSESILVLSQTWQFSDPEGTKLTFPASAPSKKIDYIAYYPKESWKVISAEVLAIPDLSDHRPYLVELEYLNN